jgi:hypothetical protein
MNDAPLDAHHAALIAWYEAQGYPPYQCVDDILDTMRAPSAEPTPVPVELTDVADIPTPEVALSITQLARYLGVTQNVLYQHVKEGVLVLDCETDLSKTRMCKAASPQSVMSYLQTKRAQRTILNSRKSEPQRRARRGA